MRGPPYGFGFLGTINAHPCLAETNCGMNEKYPVAKRVQAAPPLVVPHKTEGPLEAAITQPVVAVSQVVEIP